MGDPHVIIGCRDCENSSTSRFEAMYELIDMEFFDSESFHYRTCGFPSRGEKHTMEESLYVVETIDIPPALSFDTVAAMMTLAWAYREVTESLWPAYCAWAEHNPVWYVPDPSSFEDQYQGHYDSLKDFVISNMDDGTYPIREILEEQSVDIESESAVEKACDEGLFEDNYYGIDANGGTYIFQKI